MSSSLNYFDKVLTWADFRTVPTPKVDNGDAATIGVIWDSSHDVARNGNSIVVKDLVVNILMPDPSTNTVVASKKIPQILKHEQGHYDIIAIGAREYYKKVLKFTAASDTELNEKISALHDRLYEVAQEIDARYDVQTDHSKNEAKQAEWNKAIEETKKNANGSLSDLPK
jgi:hypothetical protein